LEGGNWRGWGKRYFLNSSDDRISKMLQISNANPQFWPEKRSFSEVKFRLDCPLPTGYPLAIRLHLLPITPAS